MGKQFRIPKVCRFPCHLAWLSVLRGPRQSSSVGSWGYFVCILSSAFFPEITAVNFLMTACLIICFKGVSPDRSGKKKTGKNKSRIDTDLPSGSGSQIQRQALHQTSAYHFLLKCCSNHFHCDWLRPAAAGLIRRSAPSVMPSILLYSECKRQVIQCTCNCPS